MGMVRVSCAALVADREDITDVRHVRSAVKNVLSIVPQILPLEEMELLDKVGEFADANFLRSAFPNGAVA